MPRLLLSALALLAAASSAAAQSIRVRTVEVETGRPIAGAIVVLLDSAGRRVVQGLTDDLGRLSLPAPGAGTYRLKADRIGHPGVLGDYFSGIPAEPVTLEMPAERFDLPEIAVTGNTVCGRSESDETARLWEEIRKALSGNQLTSASESVELSVRRFIRYRSFSGSLTSDSTTRRFNTRVTPFVTADPTSLLDRGFIQDSKGQYRFLGPDAGFLLSDGFLETHCFRFVRAEKNTPGQVGLGFEPAKGRKVPEIKGTLWVDRESAELRSVAFEYVNVPSAVRAPGLGGRLEFLRLANGGWIISDWYLRMPDRVALRRPNARGPMQVDTVVGFIDDGGTARPLGDASGELVEAGARTTKTTVMLRDVRVRLMSSAGTPIEGALVAVAELDTTVRSGATGQVRLSDVSSERLRLRVRAIGHTPLSAVIGLVGERRQIDTTLTLTVMAQRLDPIVVTERADSFVSGKMEGFERRRREGFGRFLTMEQLQDPLRASLDLQLRKFGRLWLVRSDCVWGYSAASLGGAPPGSRASCNGRLLDVCYMTVYLDGALYYSADMPGPPLDISSFNPLHLQAVEVYRSPAEIPVEYNATNSGCGVILLWTR